jgi:quinoprotein dehydrogenase-associated probable ABC transporter substrate-binding protein
MTLLSHLRGLGLAMAGLATMFGAVSGKAADGARADLVNRNILRVCIDPANMPFSNDKGEGFENKIADIIGDELKLPVRYTYFPQAIGFIRKTLAAKACDVVVGYAQGDDMVLNTNAYYRSIYALVYKKGSGLDGVDSLADPRLKTKKLGIVAGTPPANLMAQNGLMVLARPYKFAVDRRYESPTEDMIRDIRAGEIDGGVLWGPIAGYFAKHGGDQLEVVPLLKEIGGASRLGFRISMGVRNGEDDWKRKLNEVIAKRQTDIDKVLLDYGVPLIDEQDHPITAPRS